MGADSTRPLRRRVALVVVVALVALAGCSGAQMSGGGGGDGAETGQASLGGDRDARGVGSYYENGQRVVVRESRMDLRVENFSRSFRRLRAIADRNGGFVGDRRQRSQGEWDGGTVTLRVPARNFSATRDAVADLGRLEDENVEVLDFTSEFQDRQQRIQGLETDRQRLRELLNETDNASAATALRTELQEVREQLRDLRGQQQQLRQRQALSTVRVSMHEPDSRRPAETFETAFGFGDAFAQAFNGGLTAVKYVIVFFGYAIPVGFAALLAGTFAFGLWNAWRRIQGLLERAFGRGGDRPGSGPGLGIGPFGGDDGGEEDGDAEDTTEEGDGTAD